MLHPATSLQEVNPAIGLGVVATAPIPRGSITWVLDPLDQVLTPAAIAVLPALCGADLERYFWQDGDGNYVLCWDLARYVNHACDPNCLATAWGFEIAVRDIAAGEELTNDYANLGMQPHERFRCQCGAPACRGVVSAGDSDRLVAEWTARIATALPGIPRVSQPLWPLLSEAARHALLAAAPADGGPGACRGADGR